jgi:hypothetical protein
MPKSMLLAWANPVDEASDSEFNAWYNDTHIPQVRAVIPAITAVYRYRVADPPAGLAAGASASSAHRYLVVYEMDAEEVTDAMAALGTAAATGRFHLTPTMDTAVNPPVLQWYQAVG